MSNKIYTVQTNDSMTIFNDAEALGMELRDILLREVDGLWEEEAYHWNICGDEYQVEPKYAFACMLYETLTKNYQKNNQLRNIAHCYGLTPLQLPLFTTNGYWDWRDMQGMKDCHARLDEMVEWRDEFVNRIKTTFPSSGFTYKNSGYNRRTGDEWIRTVTVKVVDLDKEFFNAPKVKINQTTLARTEEEHWAHYNSKEGKAERKAAAERQREISMTMLENGWHNMSTDDDGTVRMW
tara:strand:- start:3139 stop:3849 length:711 start_codon:yes stop_codon:yes gene_type:complete